MGVSDRDYSRWTGAERRRFYSGRASLGPGLVSLLVVVAIAAAIVVYTRRHEPPSGSHVNVRMRTCVDPLHKLCGPTMTVGYTEP